MLRRIATNLPFRNLTSRYTYYFCSEPPSPLPSIPKPRTFVSPNELEKLMLDHIIELNSINLEVHIQQHRKEGQLNIELDII